MSRIINPDSIAKERDRLVRAVIVAMKELIKESQPTEHARDLVAFIIVALEAIHETVERTVIPWEKRDYWLKADRFRMEWSWTKRLADSLRKALQEEDWGTIAGGAVEIGQKFSSVKVPGRHGVGSPWVGAYQKMLRSS